MSSVFILGKWLLNCTMDYARNELLRALEVRLTALGDELATSFNQAAGAICSTQQISDLSEFAKHFGATNLR